MTAHGVASRVGRPLRIGLLALQGSFAEHAAVLRQLGAEVREVRLPVNLDALDGLIIPGGESTTIGKLLVDFDLQRPIHDLGVSGLPIYGTCAGMILLARGASGGQPPLLGLMDIDVERNAFGRQIDSFETDIEIRGITGGPFRAVFIRAPLIERVGPDVEVLAQLPAGGIVAVRQGTLLASAFHPELAGDSRFHELFLEIVASRVTDVERSVSAG